MQKEEESKGRILRKLFCSNLYISAFTFGGGFVIVTFMKRKYVDELHWLEEQEMLDITAMAQSAPGAIAVNAAILIGQKMAGGVGMVVSVLATILPPMVILSFLSFFYATFAANPYVAMVLKGMQAGVAAIILDVVTDLGRNVFAEKNPWSVGMMLLSFVAVFFLDINVILIILLAVAVGVCKVLWRRRNTEK